MKTKTISAVNAIPDMELAEDALSFGGQMVIPKGTVLDNRSITRLRFYSIDKITVVIKNEEIEKVDGGAGVINENVESTKRVKKCRSKKEQTPFGIDTGDFVDVIRCTREYKEFNSSVLESARVLENSMSAFITKHGKDLTSNDLLNLTKEIIALSTNPLHTFTMLQTMREYDDITFIHSLNVAIISHAFGKWLNLSKKDLDTLTLAGLLHDIGKMRIPENIIKKPTALTAAEFGVIKLHPRRGYNILEPMRIDNRIKNAALMHHERCDGSGYPDGLLGEDIDDFAKIIAIADIYDAMTSARVYRGPLCPFEVLGVFEKEGFQKFEPQFLIPFLDGIVESYLNSEVKLSDGTKGIIILNNKQAMSRPTIKTDNGFIDLAKQKDLSIIAIY